MSATPRYRSKTVAAWLALLFGSLGVHRVYLYGYRDVLAWLHPWPTLLGMVGVLRMRTLGLDDRLAGLLVPLLGLMLAQGMLTAIVLALTADDEWDARRNPGQTVTATGWGPVLAAIVALAVGGAVLMATVAFGAERFFEWQLNRER